MAERKLPKTLSGDQVDRLMRVPNLAAPTGLRNRAMLELMYRAGLRVSETCGVHLRDVRWREEQIHIRPEVAKGGREAFVFLDPIALDFLERWKHERRRHAAGRPHLFTTLKGDPVSRFYVWQMMQRYGRRAGILGPDGDRDELGPHMLRHTFATRLLSDGFNLREVQTLLRHADVRTTTIYTHIADQELQAKIRARR